MNLSASATLLFAGLLSTFSTILPVVSASNNNIYLRNPQSTPCSLRTCQTNSDCCSSDGWTCNLTTNKCEYPRCISNAGIGCDQDSSDVSLQCCPGWQCVDHPTGQYLGYCVRNTQTIIPNSSSSSNSNNNRGVNPNSANNPNNCPTPTYDQTCYMGVLTICCNDASTWYSCDGQCYNGDNDVDTIEE
eukprot:scaffold14319_cov148-Skeletonema_menzelii.AAC.9